MTPKLREEMIARSKRRTVPQIFIGDKHVGGCDDLIRTRSQWRTRSINSGGLMNEVRTAGPEANIGGVQVSLQSVYLKDCSYESPNGPRLPNNQAWEPKFQLNMNTSAEELAADVREVLLTITLEAKQGEATLYLVEVKQAGVFSIAGASVEDLKRLIGSFCPSVLFPYAREVISDLIVKGGFPNFLLPLVNFDALFAQASEVAATGSGQLGIRMPVQSRRAEPMTVIGAGSWGTALAIQLAREGHPTQLWGRDGAQLDAMRRARCNARYLPDAAFPGELCRSSTDLSEALERRARCADRRAIARISRDLGKHQAALGRRARASPGPPRDSRSRRGLLPHQVAREVLGARPGAVLSGPTFAREVGAGLPTAMTVASRG